MRYVNGNWIWGYIIHIGNTMSTQAELWAVRQGLSKAWNMGHRHIIDSLMVVNMLTINNMYICLFCLLL